MKRRFLDYMKEIKRKSFLLSSTKKLNSIYFSLLDEFLKKELYTIFSNEKIHFSLKDLEKKAS